MKTIIAAVCIVAFATAEPPPSNSYLPPSPTSRNGGYPRGPQSQNFDGPEVVAARTLEGQNHHNGQNHGANGFGRNGAQARGATARFGAEAQGYDQNAASFARNALEEANVEPANYNFGYMVNDYQEGTDFGHHEERQEEHAQGQYHVVLPDGRKQTVSYEADERGFKPQISYQDTEDLARNGGYDTNAGNVHANGGGSHSNGFGQHGGHF